MRSSDDGARTAQIDEQRDVPDETCTYCGEPIDTSEWYPITKRRTAAGSLELLPFCSEACQRAWNDEHAADDA